PGNALPDSPLLAFGKMNKVSWRCAGIDAGKPNFKSRNNLRKKTSSPLVRRQSHMRNHRIYQKCLVLFLALSCGLVVAIVRAQPPSFDPLAAGGPQLGEGDRVPKLEAGITAPDKNNVAQLFILATMPEGAHTYSITQLDGGPLRTK